MIGSLVGLLPCWLSRHHNTSVRHKMFCGFYFNQAFLLGVSRFDPEVAHRAGLLEVWSRWGHLRVWVRPKSLAQQRMLSAAGLNNFIWRGKGKASLFSFSTPRRHKTPVWVLETQADRIPFNGDKLKYVQTMSKLSRSGKADFEIAIF